MKLRVKTANSVYRLDTESNTWERIVTNGVVDPKYPLRTESGEMRGYSSPIIGRPLVIICPALKEGVARVITTSPVKEFHEEASN